MVRPLLVTVAVALAGCATDPVYLEARGRFGSGDPIDFHEPARLYVGPSDTTGHEVAKLSSVDPSYPPFAGMVIEVDLTVIRSSGSYPVNKSGGPAQVRVAVPGTESLSTVEYMADGQLDLLELPLGGNDRFAGSFSNVVVNREGVDLTVDAGAFRGQL